VSVFTPDLQTAYTAGERAARKAALELTFPIRPRPIPASFSHVLAELPGRENGSSLDDVDDRLEHRVKARAL